MTTTEERFWSKVDIRDKDECWPWIAGRNNRGYGQFKLHAVMQSAHRVAWELTYGNIPKDEWGFSLEVCHKCDSRSCCNPSHLFIGTHLDNVRDMDQKNRRARFY